MGHGEHVMALACSHPRARPPGWQRSRWVPRRPRAARCLRDRARRSTIASTRRRRSRSRPGRRSAGNETLGPHTVTSTTELFNSGRLDGGTSYSLKFANPGTFDYYCTVHPTMKGVVTVLAIPAEKVIVHVLGHRAQGGAGTVRVQVARSGVRALLQVRS